MSLWHLLGLELGTRDQYEAPSPQNKREGRRRARAPMRKSIQQTEPKFQILQMRKWSGTLMEGVVSQEALPFPEDLEAVNDCRRRERHFLQWCS